jgi:hypothetical protein
MRSFLWGWSLPDLSVDPTNEVTPQKYFSQQCLVFRHESKHYKLYNPNGACEHVKVHANVKFVWGS